MKKLLVAMSLLGASSLAFAQSTGEGKGQVLRIDTQKNKIAIEHGSIPDLKLPAMSLSYQISPALLKTVAVGDKVKFTAQYDNKIYSIIAIEKN